MGHAGFSGALKDVQRYVSRFEGEVPGAAAGYTALGPEAGEKDRREACHCQEGRLWGSDDPRTASRTHFRPSPR